MVNASEDIVNEVLACKDDVSNSENKLKFHQSSPSFRLDGSNNMVSLASSTSQSTYYIHENKHKENCVTGELLEQEFTNISLIDPPRSMKEAWTDAINEVPVEAVNLYIEFNMDKGQSIENIKPEVIEAYLLQGFSSKRVDWKPARVMRGILLIFLPIFNFACAVASMVSLILIVHYLISSSLQPTTKINTEQNVSVVFILVGVPYCVQFILNGLYWMQSDDSMPGLIEFCVGLADNIIQVVGIGIYVYLVIPRLSSLISVVISMCSMIMVFGVACIVKQSGLRNKLAFLLGVLLISVGMISVLWTNENMKQNSSIYFLYPISMLIIGGLLSPLLKLKKSNTRYTTQLLGLLVHITGLFLLSAFARQSIILGRGESGKNTNIINQLKLLLSDDIALILNNNYLSVLIAVQLWASLGYFIMGWLACVLCIQRIGLYLPSVLSIASTIFAVLSPCLIHSTSFKKLIDKNLFQISPESSVLNNICPNSNFNLLIMILCSVFVFLGVLLLTRNVYLKHHTRISLEKNLFYRLGYSGPFVVFYMLLNIKPYISKNSCKYNNHHKYHHSNKPKSLTVKQEDLASEELMLDSHNMIHDKQTWFINPIVNIPNSESESESEVESDLHGESYMHNHSNLQQKSRAITSINNRSVINHINERTLLINGKKYKKSAIQCQYSSVVLICTTMWHETRKEMSHFLQSLSRIDSSGAVDSEYEAHVFFDDSFIKNDYNDYVKTFIAILPYFVSSAMDMKLFATPYGLRMEWVFIHGMPIFLHLKDKRKIMNKKRWSQVMYMFYILKYRVTSDLSRYPLESVFILTTDGDVTFDAASVRDLQLNLQRNKSVGGVCGRIHPIGVGPLAWFQVFEYAIGHWFQKTSEHVMGSVLCCPGCFSMFRGSALSTVMHLYCGLPSSALEYLMYDHGEDRWLCTLLLKSGWILKYCASSDASTFCPEEFNEFYNQRRRWIASTVANLCDLIFMNGNEIRKRNRAISRLFILYQGILLVVTLLSPSITLLVLVGGVSFAFRVNSILILLAVYAVFLGYTLICLVFRGKYQLKVSFGVTIVSSLLMVAVWVGLIASCAQQLLNPNSLFLLFFAFIFLSSAIMHPREFSCLVHFWVYLLAIPSAYIFLMVYASANLNNVSWGTRENTAIAESLSETDAAEQKLDDKDGILYRVHKSLKRFAFYQWCIAEKKKRISKRHAAKLVIEELERQQRKRVDIMDIQLTGRQYEQFHNHTRSDYPQVALSLAEQCFWEVFIGTYLKPKENTFGYHDAILKQQLSDLRYSTTWGMFVLNTLWIIAITTMQMQTNLSVLNSNVMGLLFLALFVIILTIQYLAMILHRASTLIHLIAFATHLKNKKKQRGRKYPIKASNNSHNNGLQLAYLKSKAWVASICRKHTSNTVIKHDNYETDIDLQV